MTVSGVPAQLLEIMQCPACGGTLREEAKPVSLVCNDCGLRYPVRDGIPVMLIEEATPTKDDSFTG
jgi:uncharacterized protein YbaR (Trm112 family)